MLAVFGEAHAQGQRNLRRLVRGHRVEIPIHETLETGAIARLGRLG